MITLWHFWYSFDNIPVVIRVFQWLYHYGVSVIPILISPCIFWYSFDEITISFLVFPQWYITMAFLVVPQWHYYVILGIPKIISLWHSWYFHENITLAFLVFPALSSLLPIWHLICWGPGARCAQPRGAEPTGAWRSLHSTRGCLTVHCTLGSLTGH